MTDREPSAPSAHDVSGPGDRYEALVEVMEHQASQAARDRVREVEEALRRKEEGGGVPYWVLAVLLVITAWLWLFPPSMLSIEPPPPQPVEQEEAGLRFAMYLQAQRIRAFQLETGSYPERLEDAGPPIPGMEYTLLTGGLYQLTGETDRLRLTYRSDLPLDDFARSGAGVIDEEGL